MTRNLEKITAALAVFTLATSAATPVATLLTVPYALQVHAATNELSVADARKVASGTVVTVKATVTTTPGVLGGYNFYVSDDTAGVYVYMSAANATKFGFTAKVGDLVNLTGKITTYNGEVEITPTIATNTGTNVGFTPKVTAVSDLSNLQGSVVDLQGVTISNFTKFNTYGSTLVTITDASGNSAPLLIDNRLGIDYATFVSKYIEDDNADVVAVVATDSTGKLQLKLQAFEDFKPEHTVQPVTAPATISEIQGDGNESPYKNQFLDGITGVVTYIDGTTKIFVQDPNDKDDNNQNTSNGIFVKTTAATLTNAGVKVGDLISFDGLVSEIWNEGYSDAATTDLTLTSVTNISNLKVLSSGNELPTADDLNTDKVPTDTATALKFWEAREGMLVSESDAVLTGPIKNSEFDTLIKGNSQLTTSMGGYLLQPDKPYAGTITWMSNSSNTKGDLGDYYTQPLVGPVYYSYGRYKVKIKQDDLINKGFVNVNNAPEVTNVVGNAEKLTVSEFNIENFTAAPATDDARVNQIAKQIVDNLKTPDIISLEEVQDNNGAVDDGTVDATATLQRLVDAIAANGGPTYQFLQIDPENDKDGGAPGANIRVAMLYNPNRVSLFGGSDAKAGSTNTLNSWTADGHLAQNPGRLP
ncbi:MAG: hypothetical protein LBM27_01505, partial [Lactobacillaceae bacterium]|nr:hypothetical protein [Lactobacillaceae bacterium]